MPMGFARTLFRSLENPKVSLQDPEAWEDLFGAPQSSSGVRVTRKRALELSGVFRGTNLIATTVAKIPLFVYQREGEGKIRDRRHAAYPILRRRANRYHSAFTLKQTLTSHAILQGGGYGYILRSEDGTPLEVLPLLPDRTYPVRENGRLLFVTSLGGTLEDETSELRKLDADDVLHIHGLSYDGFTGYSILELAREELGLAIGQTKFASLFFRNAATPKVVIQVPEQLSDVAFKRLKDSWHQMRSGLEHAHKTAILEQGATVQPLSISARDSQLIESRKFDLVAIANWLGLPVHKVGGEGRTAYSSLEQENQSFLDEAIDGWLCTWEAECYDKLLTEDQKEAESHEIEFVRQAILRADMARRAGYYRGALGGRPWMKQNEVRALENLNPVEGGDVILEPKNMGQGGADNAPKNGEGDDAGRALRDAAEQILRDAAARMVNRIAVHARKAAKKPERFTVWLDDELFAQHQGVVREALAPAQRLAETLDPSLDDPSQHSIASWLLGRVREDLAEACRELSRGELADGLETLFRTWGYLPGEAARTFLKK